MHALFYNIEEKDKNEAIDDLIHDSTPRPSFFFLVILSVAMATFGLLINNASVIIGSMLIAPILSPIMSLALGIVMADSKIITRSLFTLSKSSGYGLLIAIIATILFGANTDFYNAEIISRTEPSFLYLAIAIVAGTATAFARVKPELNDALPGTAIAVALVPPLAVSGIGIAKLDWNIATGAFQMFILNGVGIVLAAMVMFSLMNLYTKRTLASHVQKREDRKLAKQLAAADKRNGKTKKHKEK